MAPPIPAFSLTPRRQSLWLGSVPWRPYAEYINWTFGIQRQITRDMSISVSYVGSQGHFLSASGLNLQLSNKLHSNYLAPGWV